MSDPGSSTTSPLANPNPREITHQVYWRSAKIAPPPFNGERHGWSYAPYMTCQWVRIETGPRIGVAELVIFPLENTDAEKSFEAMLAGFSTDDQVRVVAQPPIDELQDQIPPTGDDLIPGVVLFEGRLSKLNFLAQGNEQENKESVTATAVALPVLDNELAIHQVIGRWVTDRSDDTKVRLLDGYSLPAIFNHRDKPNMYPTSNVLTAGQEFFFNGWTTDDDLAGAYWNVRNAIASLLGQWLYGSVDPLDPTKPQFLPRFTYIEPETLAALCDDGSTGRPERWKGLDDRLKETRVQGMGVYEALQTVCGPAGFDFAIVPDQNVLSDRPWKLSIWRRGSGELVAPALAKRGSTFADGEATLEQNDVNTLNAMLDSSEITSYVIGLGKVVIEGTVQLRPLWNLDEMDAAPASAALQKQPTPAQLNGEGTYGGYFSKHVAGGVLFEKFKHVGRRWGIAHRADSPGYESGPYSQLPFDWVDAFGMNEEDSLLRQNREAGGVGLPIYWSDRIRTAEPLKHPEAVKRSIEYVLEVSEDFGATWAVVPWRASSLRKFFGIQLDIENLAAVNLQSMATHKKPLPAASWWGLIKSQQLLFELTASIEADHGARYDARLSPTAGTAHPLCKVLLADNEERYAHSSHYFQREAGIDDTWQRLKLPGYDAANPNPVKSLATRTRDANEDWNISCTIATWIMDLRKYALGQRVKGLRGRNISFAASGGAGNEARYPNVVGITYRLASRSQGIELSLGDHRLAAGR